MKFIIDDADIEKVREIWDLYPCDGVTTNPSLIAKEGRDFNEKSIRSIN